MNTSLSRQKRRQLTNLMAGTIALDNFEEFLVGMDVNGLSGGTGWGITLLKRHRQFSIGRPTGGNDSVYVDNYPGIGLGTGDDMESYTVTANLDGLNGGQVWFLFWGTPYTSNDFTMQDDMESYTVAANLNGLNGGAASSPFWGGAYVDR
jgi:hypothetical protein